MRRDGKVAPGETSQKTCLRPYRLVVTGFSDASRAPQVAALAGAGAAMYVGDAGVFMPGVFRSFDT